MLIELEIGAEAGWWGPPWVEAVRLVHLRRGEVVPAAIDARTRPLKRIVAL